jgi:hypothetical protein
MYIYLSVSLGLNLLYSAEKCKPMEYEIGSLFMQYLWDVLQRHHMKLNMLTMMTQITTFLVISLS